MVEEQNSDGDLHWQDEDQEELEMRQEDEVFPAWSMRTNADAYTLVWACGLIRSMAEGLP
jgi:hypothetical protein